MSETTIQRLAKAVEENALSTPDHDGIISDLGALATSGISKTSSMLTLFKANANEDYDDAWEAMHGILFRLNIAWLDQPAEICEKLKTFERNLFAPLVKRIGFEAKKGEDSMITRLRTRAIMSSGNAGDPDTVAKVRGWLNEIISGTQPSPVHADLIEPVFAVAVNQGGEREYEAAKQYHLNENNPVDQHLVALRALGSTTLPHLMGATLEFSVSDNVRRQDLHISLVHLSLTQTGRDKVWAWYQYNYNTLIQHYGDSLNYLSMILRNSISGFTSEEKAQEIEGFFKGKDVSRFDRALNQSLETIRTYAGWVGRDAKDVKQ